MRHKKQTHSITFQKVAFPSVLLTLALLIGFLENLLPPVIPPLPYFKIGLSNVVILFSALTLGYRGSVVIVGLKSFLMAVFQGSPIAFLYSFPAGILALAITFLLLQLKKLGLPTIGFFSAIVHNSVQLAVAALMTGSIIIFAYFPVLLIVGGLSGILTGLLVCFLLRALPKNKLLHFFQ